MQQEAATPPFSSTGPQGHRARMRGRLLTDEAALADYEILEMLLFLGIERRDTKPMAKALINRFGSLPAALSAAVEQPEQLGLPGRAVAAMAMVRESAELLAQPETGARKRLDSWDSLLAHLDLPGRAGEAPGISALLLNSRNQLIAEPGWAEGGGPEGVMVEMLARQMMRQALERHASAVLVVRHGAGRPRLLPRDRALHAAVRRAAGPLSVAVHDLIVCGQGKWISMKQTGLA